METPASESRKVPVTIITGFLGAGKTTFLKRVMVEQHGRRILVIQNEFGAETGIEKATVINQDGGSSQEWLELANGCICCTVKGDFVNTIEKLMARKDKFDFIFIELDGLADPGPVASTFWLDDELESDLYLDAIVAVVDAKHILQHLDEKKAKGAINEAQRQIAFADRIILNKRDLVTAEEMHHIRERVRLINSVATVHEAQQANVPLELMLNINAFSMEHALSVEKEQKQAAEDDAQHGHAHNNHSEHDEHTCCKGHQHDDSVVSVTLESHTPLPLDDFRNWLAKWLWPDSGGESVQVGDEKVQVFRVKGYVHIEGHETKHQLQGVHELFDLQPSNVRWAADEKRGSRIVVIGRRVQAVLADWQREFGGSK